MKDLATVIEGMKKRDKNSFQIMVKHYAPSLMTVAIFYAKNKHDAEDILQDSFIRIFLNIKKFHFEGEELFYGWCKKIVTNTALGKYRRKYFTHELLTANHSSLQKTEEPLIIEKYNLEEILDCIYALPLKYREVIGLYSIEGYSHAEIAEILNIKESSSRSIYSRAKSKLKVIIDSTKTFIY